MIALKRKPGRPKLSSDNEKMELLSVQIPRCVRKNLDTISVRCDKSISELTRSALSLLVFVYDKENPHE